MVFITLLFVVGQAGCELKNIRKSKHTQAHTHTHTHTTLNEANIETATNSHSLIQYTRTHICTKFHISIFFFVIRRSKWYESKI